MVSFEVPNLSYFLLGPILIVLAGAVLGVVAEAFLSRTTRPKVQLGITLLTLVLAFVQLWRIRSATSLDAAMGSVAIDGPAILFQGSILIMALLGVFLIADQQNFTVLAAALPGSTEERDSLQSGEKLTEVYPLTLFAVAGMLLFPIATDLITLFVALEVLSLPLYLMAGLSRHRRLLSQEAALKYFLLGAFSSAFFLFGAAYLYGYSGSVSLAGIQAAVTASSGNSVFLFIGIAFLSVGLLFKVGAVPFHAWSPDVYQGAPTPVTAFMAAATKVAAFGAMLRIFYTAFDNAVWEWRPVITTIAIITMLFGSFVAIAQRDVKRMLAYSSIAHAGFILSGVIALNKAGLEASIFYLFAYGIVTIGAFAVVTLVRDSQGEVTDINRWAGLGKRSPMVATAFALFLLAFAGIPLTSGFIGKFSIFSAAYESGNKLLVVVGVLSSAIAAYFYIRVIVLMFFTNPVDDATSVVIPSFLTKATITIAFVITLFLGIFPSPLLNFISTTATFIR
jgi:NADH-quinone oxidoreductase subunit N